MRDSEQLNNPVDMNSCNTLQKTSCGEEDMDVPDILEDIIELLLSGLRDTVCRGLFSTDLDSSIDILSTFLSSSYSIISSGVPCFC